MTLKKFVTMLCAGLLLVTVACGGGHESADDDEGEDDEVETASADTAGGATAAPATAAPAAAADAATIMGMVKFEGAAAQTATLQMGADPYCQSQHTSPVKDEEVVVGPGGELANVLVYIENAPAGPPNTTPAVLDQRGCQYYPHVTAIQVGQPLQIKNSDSTLHNVHAMPNVNGQFNVGQPVQNMVTEKKFDKVEMKPFRVKCDVHGWMKSFMAVLPNSYHAVSLANGTFTIPNLPPGQYNLVAWHEKYGEQKQPVTVGAKEQKQVAFTFKG